MLQSSLLFDTPIGIVLGWLHVLKHVYPEHDKEHPWVKIYSKISIPTDRSCSQVDKNELQTNLRRFRDVIESRNDTRHGTTELYRVHSEIDRQAPAPLSYDDGPATHEGIVRDIYPDIVRRLEKPSQYPSMYSDGTVICDWYGDTDTANPLNWSLMKKLYVVSVVTACSFVVYVSAPIWVPSGAAFRKEFSTDYEYTALGLALFVLGYGTGPLLFAPLSEIARIGRNPPYVITFIMFMGITVAVALVRNAPAFMFFRFLQGFFGSPILATGGASLADVYSPISLPFAMTAWAYACFVAPVVGPIVASAAIPHLGWHFSIWEILIASGPVMFMILLLPETSSPTILHRRAHRLREVTQRSNIRAQSEISKAHIDFRSVLVESLLIPMRITLSDPAILFTNLYMMLIYGIYYSFFEAFPLVYGDIYDFNLLQNGLAFIPIAVGTTISLIIYMYYLYFFRTPKIRKGEGTQPEHVLLPGCIASVLPPLGLFLFGWGANQSVHWIVSMVGVALYPMGVYVVFQGLFLYLPLCYPQYAASLFAASDMTRCAFGMATVLFARPLYTKLGIGPACSLLAGLMVCCVFGIIALYKLGPTLRRKSKFNNDT